jgi:hypothetical protein
MGLAGFIGCDGSRRDDGPIGQLGPTGSGGSGGGFTGIVGPGSSGSGNAGGGANVIADPDAPCDSAIDIGTSDPLDGARAVGLCKQAADMTDWGVVDARWSLADGSDPPSSLAFDLGHGVLPQMGFNIDPKEGSALLVLSSGTAREPGDPDFQSPQGYAKNYTSNHPLGFPKESPACPGVITGEAFDDVALEVTLRSPEGAESLAYDFNFLTFEWPDFVCSTYNDFFVGLLTPYPAGQMDGNISFDTDGNPVSVNNVLVRVCGCQFGAPCPAPPANPLLFYDCDLGDDELAGTGFETRAGTGWLVTKAPVTAGETIQLRWAVYDSGDAVLDSTVVLDNFRWLGDPTVDPETVPVPK